MGTTPRGTALLKRRFGRSRQRTSSLDQLSHRPSQKQVLLCAIIAFGVFLFASSRNHGRCPTATPASSTIVASSSSAKELNFGKKPFQIVVLTHSRKDSLLRLLNSVGSADYGGDSADLHVWVDRSASEHGWLSQLYPLDTVDEDTVRVASNFEWPHGNKEVHVWDKHVGIWGQWLDTYRPSGKDSAEFGVLLEDDLEVSPLYYKWLKSARIAYGHRQDIFGYTLQRGTLRANQTGFGRRPLRISEDENAYLYLLVGSWGYAPEAKAWARFREWFHAKSCEPEYHPYVDGLIPTKWYKKQEKKRSMWTMWHIKYADLFKVHTVYANLRGGRTLASNWREPGLHFRKSANKKKASSVTGEKDFALLEREFLSGSRISFEFPEAPRIVAWNGTYVGRDGLRTKH